MSAEPALDNSFSSSHTRPAAAASTPLLEISNAMVRLYKQAFGRGPTKVRTVFAGPDAVMVLLEDGFTIAERSLLSLGESDILRKSRLTVQEALEERARSLVEGALRRRTRAFITGIDPRRGVAVNLFTLEPAAVVNGDQDDESVSAGEAG